MTFLFSPAPTQSEIQIALRFYLTDILPTNVEVIAGQQNRVAEPRGEDFVVFWPLDRPRLATNIDLNADVAFTGEIVGGQLTVTLVSFGTIRIGAPVFGIGVLPNTRVTGYGTAIGGIGTYAIEPAQIIASQRLAAGTIMAMQETEITFQLDIHGPNSSDNTQTITTLFRDEYGIKTFMESGIQEVTPLYTSTPRQMPFINAEQQYEMRWVVEACIQANHTVAFPQQFMDSAVIRPIIVDTTFLP